MKFIVKHLRLRDAKITVNATLFDVDSDGVLSVGGDTNVDPLIVRKCRSHPNYIVQAVKEAAPAPKKPAPKKAPSRSRKAKKTEE